jgi:HlyD family secretion protein
MAESKIFRKVALDRLSSPEQLDELMEVTTSKAWAALLTMAVLLLLLLVWSFTGSLPTKIHATGILLKEGGVADVSATAGGQITQIIVREVVARLAQPAKAEEVAASEARLAELRLEFERLSALGSEGNELRTEKQAQQRANLWAEIRTAQGRKKYLEGRLASQQSLFDKGLITSQALQSTRSEVQGAQSTIDALSGRLMGLKIDELGATKRGESGPTTRSPPLQSLESGEAGQARHGTAGRSVGGSARGAWGCARSCSFGCRVPFHPAGNDERA